MTAIEEMERELAEPLRHFRGAVKAMAERELAQTRRVALPAEKKVGWRPVWVYAWAPAGLLVVLMAVGLMMQSHTPMQQAENHGPNVAQTEAPPAGQQRLSDTALMTEIDEDLNQNAPTPLAPLEVSTANTQANTTQAEGSDGVQP